MKSFKGYVDFVLRHFKRREKTPPSFLRALAHVTGEDTIKKVLSSSPDRRHWLALAAAWVGITERDLIGKVGREMGLSTHVADIDGLTLSHLGAEPRTFLQELRKAGVVPSGKGAEIETVYCVDPTELSVLPVGLSYTIRLAPWNNIEAALRKMEGSLDERDEAARRLEREKTHDVARQILGFLLVEVESYGAQELTILNGDEGLAYSFSTHDGRQASGKVFPRVASSLLEYFETIKDSGSASVLLHGKGAYRDIRVSALAPGGNFRLMWFMPDMAVMPSLVDAPQTSSFNVITSDISLTKDPRHVQNNLAHEPVARDVVKPVMPVSSSNSRRPLVVVIDDNVMFVKVLERFLDRGGMDSVHALNGEEGLKLLKDIPLQADLPPVVVCDLHMPVMNGREFISRLRQEPTLKYLKVVILTSDDDVEAELNLITLGADAFLAKSKDPRVLTAQVRRLAGVPAEAQAA